MSAMSFRKVYVTILAVVFLASVGIGAAGQMVIKVAISGEPPTLDCHLTTAGSTAQVVANVFEMPFALTKDDQPVPHLVAAYDVGSELKTYTFNLRQGVLFHNGNEMKADDMAASIERWATYSSRGGMVGQYLESVEAVGDYKVILHLSQPFTPLLTFLAYPWSGGPAVYPKEVIDRAGSELIPLEDCVGTGPFKVVEWKADQYVRLVRFEEYSLQGDSPDGYAGNKFAYADEVCFYFVPESLTRVSGIQSRTYDIAENIDTAYLATLVQDDRIAYSVAGAPTLFNFYLFNCRSPLMQDVRMRRAIQAAADTEELALGVLGSPDLFELDHTFMRRGTALSTTAGLEYTSPDAEIGLAKQLLEEVGYAGEKVRLIASADYKVMADSVFLLSRQLARAGINTELLIVDTATYFSMRGNPDAYDIATGIWDFKVTPLMLMSMSPEAHGWCVSPARQALIGVFVKQVEPVDQFHAWGCIQSKIMEDVAAINVFSYRFLNITTPEITGMNGWNHMFFYMWGVQKT